MQSLKDLILKAKLKCIGNVLKLHRNVETWPEKGRQLDGLADVAALLSNSKEKYWRMVNGYCLPVDPKSMRRLAERIAEVPEDVNV